MAPAPTAAKDHSGTPIELDTIKPDPPPSPTRNTTPSSPPPTYPSTVTHDPTPTSSPPLHPSTTPARPGPVPNPNHTAASTTITSPLITTLSRLKRYYNESITPTIPLGPVGPTNTNASNVQINNDIRDHLALERTFLSRFRTANALALFGVLVIQLFRLTSPSHPTPSSSLPSASTTPVLANTSPLSNDTRTSNGTTIASPGIVDTRDSVAGKALAAIAISGAVMVVLAGGWKFVEQQRGIREGRVVVGGWKGVWVEGVVVGVVVVAGCVVVGLG